MLTSSQLTEFEKNGYLLIKNRRVCELKSSLSASLREIALVVLRRGGDSILPSDINGMGFCELVDYAHSIEKDVELTSAIYDLCKAHPSFMSLVNASYLLDTCKALGLGTPIASTIPLIRIDRPRQDKFLVPSHQDFWFSMLSKSAITFWFSLNDIDESHGPLLVFPGSHKLGITRMRRNNNENPFVTIDNYDEQYVEVLAAPDEILVFSQLLIHKSGANKSHQNRISVQVRYSDLDDVSQLKSSFVVNNSPTTLELQKVHLQGTE